ncbi:MAG: SCE4755 family polysaccharide monooxygenase-like protein [Acidobacteriota bacterium]
MKRFAGFTLAAIALVLAPHIVDAHFKLLAPESWITESALGDPQKLGPCGGTSANAKGPANPGTPTNIVNKAVGGSMLHIKVQETVYHPGFYRISLAVNSRTELPADPEVTLRDSAKGPQSVAAKIMYPPTPPVLADGLWQHQSKMADPVMETDVLLPNINCAKCTLQVAQFMAEHGRNADGDFTYHHCSDIQITADASKPIDTRWPTQK